MPGGNEVGVCLSVLLAGHSQRSHGKEPLQNGLWPGLSEQRCCAESFPLMSVGKAGGGRTIVFIPSYRQPCAKQI
jgi:hypothetical protein